MITTIGENAGKVWRLLNDNPKMAKTKVAKTLNMKRSDVDLALGWLARENKLGEVQQPHDFIPNSQKTTLIVY